MLTKPEGLHPTIITETGQSMPAEQEPPDRAREVPVPLAEDALLSAGKTARECLWNVSILQGLVGRQAALDMGLLRETLGAARALVVELSIAVHAAHDLAGHKP